MGDAGLYWLIGGGAALLLLLLYGFGRWRARRRQRAALRMPRRLRKDTLAEWTARGWLQPAAEGLPAGLSPAEVFLEWAWTDPDAAAHWRLGKASPAGASVETLVREAWSRLPEGAKPASNQRLRAAVEEAGTWWGGAPKGWNRRPLVVQAGAVGKKQQGLPLLPVEDLTGAPEPFPVATRELAEAEGPDLVLLLAVLRHASPSYTHPLAPGKGGNSLIAGLAPQVATDIGRRVGGGLGAALGPIGSMVGQYLGEMAGSLGGKALAEQSVPAELAGPLKETEAALERLGELAGTEAFPRAAKEPEERIVELGGRLEGARERRARGLRERLWPTPGFSLVEVVMQAAMEDLRGYRAAAEHFAATARKGPPAVAGGMLLQNPWLVRSLPEGVERLNAARGALNRAALALKRSAGSKR
jgi:hypothetical protein